MLSPCLFDGTCLRDPVIEELIQVCILLLVNPITQWNDEWVKPSNPLYVIYFIIRQRLLMKQTYGVSK